MSRGDEQAKEPITPEDIEGALRSFSGGATETVTELKGKIIAAASVVVVIVVVGTFWLGRARGKKRTTVVEIRRV
ncbi:MAG: hypothetical protein ACC652_14165 [Acidimicrobiales bacterium]